MKYVHDFYMHVNVFWLQTCIGKGKKKKKVIQTFISVFYSAIGCNWGKKKKKKAVEAEPSLERF